VAVMVVVLVLLLCRRWMQSRRLCREGRPLCKATLFTYKYVCTVLCANALLCVYVCVRGVWVRACTCVRMRVRVRVRE